MIAAAHFADPIRWNDPSTWPLFVYIWLAIFVSGPALEAWRWLRREQSKSWPTATGHIEAATIAEPKRFLGITLQSQRNREYKAVLSYSFSLSGDSFRGTYKREFSSEEEALDFLHDLEGQPVSVHYNPSKAADSVLLESDVESLLASRPPVPPNPALLARRALPSWLKPLLGPLAVTSLVGLVVSLCVHLGALLGQSPAAEWLFFTLHFGIFVVWFPAVLVVQKRVGHTSGRDVLKKALRGAPEGLRVMVYAFFAYAFLNFALYCFRGWMRGSSSSMSSMDWRGFSGHWMAFYSAALAIFLAAIHSSRDGADR